MQRILIALAFALTISSAFGAYSLVGNWSKNPVQNFVQDNDTSFTNIPTSRLSLLNTNTGEISLVNLNFTSAANTTTFSWNAWWRKVDTKALSAGAAASLNWTAPQTYPFTALGYAITIATDNNTGTPALRAYQQPLSGGAALAPITLGNNTNSSFLPAAAGGSILLGKSIYVFYKSADKTLSLTSFTVGGGASTAIYNISTSYDDSTFQAVSGDALGSSQVFASWQESAALKDSVIDVTKGTVSANTVTGWNNNYMCYPYSTDKKWYGDFCYMNVAATNTTNASFQTYVRNGTSGLIQLASYASGTTFHSLEPYGPYLAVFFTNGTTAPVPSPVIYSYEIWNLDTLNNTPQAKRDYLTTDVNSTFSKTRLPAGGIYGLIYNRGQNNVTYSSISVGIVLGSSYLTSVLGFIMTIVAGLFLF